MAVRINSQAVGAYVSALTPELLLEARPFRGAQQELRDPEIAHETLHTIPQDAHGEPEFQRPAWLSPEIVPFVVGALDWCLVLTAAAAAFTVYFTVMDQTIAQP